MTVNFWWHFNTMSATWHGAIHSKSESRDPYGAAKKLNFPQFFPKMPRNGPKMTQSGTNMTQNGPKMPKMAQEWPKMTQNGPKMTRTFSAIFFDWKGGSANLFAFRMYGNDWGRCTLYVETLGWKFENGKEWDILQPNSLVHVVVIVVSDSIPISFVSIPQKTIVCSLKIFMFKSYNFYNF